MTKDKEVVFRSKDNHEIAYHLENIDCFGCHKQFCLTVRNPENEEDKLCANCFGHIVGLDDYQKVLGELDELSITTWHTPVNELSKDDLKEIQFIQKSRNR
jgi:hypothetical protein